MWKALTVLVVVQPAPVLQWLYRRCCEKAKNGLNPAWHWGALVVALRDVQGQEHHGMPKFLHLSCSGFLGVKAGNFRPPETEILLQPKGAFSRSAAPLCFPSWSSMKR